MFLVSFADILVDRCLAQAVYSKTLEMVLMYGGQGYSDWQTPSVNVTTETSVLSDFWCVDMISLGQSLGPTNSPVSRWVRASLT